jgi:hypothetical protein
MDCDSIYAAHLLTLFPAGDVTAPTGLYNSVTGLVGDRLTAVIPVVFNKLAAESVIPLLRNANLAAFLVVTEARCLSQAPVMIARMWSSRSCCIHELVTLIVDPATGTSTIPHTCIRHSIPYCARRPAKRLHTV